MSQPDGTTVRIGRRWLPWRRRLRHLDALDLPDIPLGDDPVSAALTVIALIIAIPFMVLFALSFGELLILIALLPLILLARVALRRPWTVEVTREGELVTTRQAADWPSSRVLITDLAHAAERGDLLP